METNNKNRIIIICIVVVIILAIIGLGISVYFKISKKSDSKENKVQEQTYDIESNRNLQNEIMNSKNIIL